MIEIEWPIDIDIPSLIDGDQDWSVLEENGYSKGIPEKIEIQAPENIPEIKITYPEIYGFKTPERNCFCGNSNCKYENNKGN